MSDIENRSACDDRGHSGDPCVRCGLGKCPAWADGKHCFVMMHQQPGNWAPGCGRYEVDRPSEVWHVVDLKVCACGATVERTKP